jgi:hypothetical protein
MRIYLSVVQLLAHPSNSIRALHKIHVRWIFVSVWVCLFLLHSALYLALVPAWQAPDEPTSIELLLTMQKYRRLVSLDDKDVTIEGRIVESMVRTRYWDMGGYSRVANGQELTFATIYPWSNTQLHRPPLYQLAFLPLANLIHDWPLEHQLFMFRFVNILLSAMIVAVAVLIAYELVVLHWSIPFVLPALIVFLPQFAYSSATFNSDSLVSLLGALIFHLVGKIVRHGISAKYIIWLCVLFILGVLTKRTILFLLPVVVATILLQVTDLRRMLSRGPERISIESIAIIGLLLLSVATWRSNLSRLIDRLMFETDRSSYLASLHSRITQSPASLWTWIETSIPFLNRSFWGSFGWHTVSISSPVAIVLLCLVIGTWICALALSVRSSMPYPAWARRYIWLSILAAASAVLTVFLMTPLPTLPQGRYLFVVLIPIMILVTVGLCSWWSQRWTAHGIILVWLFLIALDLYTIFWVMIPGFY